VDVGQDLYAPPFALFIKAHAEELEGPGFDDVWSQVWATMDTHLLAPDAERLLDETSRPRQEVAIGYWRDLLDRPFADIDIWAASRLAAVRAAGVPYLVVAGDDPGRLRRDWLASLLPDASVTVFPKSGQFPHLAHPLRFAETLAEFADAQAAVPRE
jgi:pimeloyl-ACP methyl ester carboxylesterase